MSTTPREHATLREHIDARPMGLYQIVIIAIMTYLNALDGYDVLAMSFTANPVKTDFGLSDTELGFLLSAGLIGMAVGAITLGPFADRMGRKRTLVLSLIVNAVGLVISAVSGSFALLLVARIITGLGVGGILACTTVIVSEFSNTKRRGLTISLYASGYPVGATIGGTLAAWLIEHISWHAVFVAGAALTVVAILLVVFVVPESPEQLNTRTDDRSRASLRRIAERIGYTGEDLGAPKTTTVEQIGYRALVSKRYRGTTIALWISFFAIMFGFYFASTWTPQMLTDMGMSQQQGILGGIMLTIGGTIGTLAFGFLTTFWRPRHLLIVFSVLGAVMLTVFILTTGIATVAFICGVGVGMLINGAIGGLYTIAPAAYGPKARSTGVGVALGVGRAGAILAPILAGAFLDAGATPTQIYIGVSAVVAVAALVVWRVREYDPADDAPADSARDGDGGDAATGAATESPPAGSRP
ncbi:MFS transporter [Pseudoclavibacter endophyticus]|nr:MFS transporter [Pseudoclavibacter endophyticus]